MEKKKPPALSPAREKKLRDRIRKVLTGAVVAIHEIDGILKYWPKDVPRPVDRNFQMQLNQAKRLIDKLDKRGPKTAA